MVVRSLIHLIWRFRSHPPEPVVIAFPAVFRNRPFQRLHRWKAGPVHRKHSQSHTLIRDSRNMQRWKIFCDRIFQAELSFCCKDCTVKAPKLICSLKQYQKSYVYLPEADALHPGNRIPFQIECLLVHGLSQLFQGTLFFQTGSAKPDPVHLCLFSSSVTSCPETNNTYMTRMYCRIIVLRNKYCSK